MSLHDKWEYEVIKNFLDTDFGFIKSVDYISKLGEEGWEMTGIYSEYIIFKRKYRDA